MVTLFVCAFLALIAGVVLDEMVHTIIDRIGIGRKARQVLVPIVVEKEQKSSSLNGREPSVKS